MNNRIIFSDDGTLVDYSTTLADYKNLTKTLPFVAADDALYIGSKFPFNHLYFKLSVANTAASVISIAVYDNNDWEDVVEIIDETSLGGASFGQSGFITWTPNKQEGWARDDTTKSNGDENITGLGNVVIYERYWLKITFSNDLDVTTALQWVGNKFSDDDDLASEFPNLVRSAVLSGFATGKTDWEEQHVKAADIIINHLVNNKIILTKDQILERREFILASTYKVADIIFSSYGDNGENDQKKARAEYSKRINEAVFAIDRNTNAREDIEEIEQTEGRISRR